MNNYCIYCGNDIKDSMSLPVLDENWNDVGEVQCMNCFNDNIEVDTFDIVPSQHYRYTIPGINTCYEDDYRDALGRIYYTTNEKAMKKMFSGLIHICDPPKLKDLIIDSVHMHDAMKHYVIGCDPIGEDMLTVMEMLEHQEKQIHIICGVTEPIKDIADKLKEEVFIIKKSPDMPLIDYSLFREPKPWTGPRRGKRKIYGNNKKKKKKK